ncbi:hypothetical protein ND981_15910 [Vibrio diabolicus]|uniref:hypothetical protein n=1 Tax=Vibrio diabolicus TaxID=50719 RepID=UPI00215F03B7|nr:hypothetical protein [Vibrio diabolicus]MCS0334419.1 hypothetical protein [Vibrio diabolicus]
MSVDDRKDSNVKSSSEPSVSSDVITISKITAPLLAKAAANIISSSSLINFPGIVLSTEKKKSLAEEKTELMRELAKLEVDPETFDTLLTNELDRKLKVNFGVAFLVLTCIFTIASYAIVVLDSVYSWGISEIAITALIIETPIQFIGLLYIIARNLFPQAKIKP